MARASRHRLRRQVKSTRKKTCPPGAQKVTGAGPAFCLFDLGTQVCHDAGPGWECCIKQSDGSYKCPSGGRAPRPQRRAPNPILKAKALAQAGGMFGQVSQHRMRRELRNELNRKRRQLRGTRKGPPSIGCAPQLLPESKQESFKGFQPRAHYGGCRTYHRDCGCPPGWWTAHQTLPPPVNMPGKGHAICCPPQCMPTIDDYAPPGYIEAGLWPRSGPGYPFIPPAPDVINLGCPVERCPPGWSFGPDGRCWPAGFEGCFYTEYGNPAPQCPPGTYEKFQPDWSQDQVRACCPIPQADFEDA